MSKLIAKSVYQSFLPNNEIAISFVATDKYAANLFLKELEKLEKIELNAKAYKESRSIQQNKFLWSLISKISQELNGEETEASTMKIYGDLLVQAQIKRELVAILPQALETLKNRFRAVIPTGQRITTKNELSGKETTLISVWVYEGSSSFNTKEMNSLLDLAINYASELGINDSEIESLRKDYL